MFGLTMKCATQVAWFIAFVALTGCGEGNKEFISRIAQYREPLNSARIAKSIPIVPANWVPRGDRSAAAWDNPEFIRNRKAAVHQYKFLTFSDPYYNMGTLISETDHYESGKEWQDPAEGTQVEFIRITYSYADERAGKNPWKAQAHRQQSGFEDISLENATAVLGEWGISRLEQNSGISRTSSPADSRR
jgi:hypothetical protein